MSIVTSKSMMLLLYAIGFYIRFFGQDCWSRSAASPCPTDSRTSPRQRTPASSRWWSTSQRVPRPALVPQVYRGRYTIIHSSLLHLYNSIFILHFLQEPVQGRYPLLHRCVRGRGEGSVRSDDIQVRMRGRPLRRRQGGHQDRPQAVQRERAGAHHQEVR